jgi:hypothetical protein
MLGIRVGVVVPNFLGQFVHSIPHDEHHDAKLNLDEGILQRFQKLRTILIARQ